MTPTPAGSLKAAIEVIPELPEPANEYSSDDFTFSCPEGYDDDQMLTYARQYHAANSADLLARLEAAERVMKDAEKFIDLSITMVQSDYDSPPEPKSQWDYDAGMLVFELRNAIAVIKGEAN